MTATHTLEPGTDGLRRLTFADRRRLANAAMLDAAALAEEMRQPDDTSMVAARHRVAVAARRSTAVATEPTVGALAEGGVPMPHATIFPKRHPRGGTFHIAPVAAGSVSDYLGLDAARRKERGVIARAPSTPRAPDAPRAPRPHKAVEFERATGITESFITEMCGRSAKKHAGTNIAAPMLVMPVDAAEPAVDLSRLADKYGRGRRVVIDPAE